MGKEKGEKERGKAVVNSSKEVLEAGKSVEIRGAGIPGNPSPEI